MFPLPLLVLILGLVFSPALYRWHRWQKPIYLAIIVISIISLFVSGIPFSKGFFSLSWLNKFAAFLFLFISLLIISASKRRKEICLKFLVLVSLVAAGLAANFFTFYIAIEILIVSSSFLILNPRFKRKSLAAARKYLLLNIIGSTLILLSIGFSLPSIKILSSPEIVILAASGLLIKSAIFPFHSWLVDAHSVAKSPASALLSGIVASIGIFGLMKFVPLAGMQEILLALALATSFYASITALGEWDLKRLLAWSTLVNFGYILFALALLTSTGFFASLFHLFNHGIAKALAFLSGGILIRAASARDLRRLKGYGRCTIGICFLFSLLSLMSVPPFSCFLSELFIFLAGIGAGQFWIVIAFLACFFISLLWYLRILYYLFFRKSKHLRDFPKQSLWKTVPIGIMAFLTLFIGIWPSPFLTFAKLAATTIG